MKFIKLVTFFILIILISSKLKFGLKKESKSKNMKMNSNRHFVFNNKKNFHDVNNKINCNDICNSFYSRSICNLGIVAGENDKLGSDTNLTCSCITNKLRGDEQTLVNKHIHYEWCFDVFGCYESNSGKCMSK